MYKTAIDGNNRTEHYALKAQHHSVMYSALHPSDDALTINTLYNQSLVYGNFRKRIQFEVWSSLNVHL